MSLELRDIHKHFGPVRANDGITLTVETGTLHGLLGENGAGKSTLMKVLSGFHSADSGEIVLDGQTVKLASPVDAIAAGIGMLHQDPLVFLPFSVIDNFVLGSPGGRRLDRKAAAAELRRIVRAVRVQPRSGNSRPAADGRRAPATRDRPPAVARRSGPHPRRADHRHLCRSAGQALCHTQGPGQGRHERHLRVAQAGGGG